MSSDPADWWKDEPGQSELERAILRDKAAGIHSHPSGDGLSASQHLRPSHAQIQAWFLAMERAKPEASGFVRYFKLADGRALKVTLEVEEP